MPFVEKRLSGPTQLTTSAQSIYTVPAGGQSAVIRQLVVTNVSASAATFTFYVGTESASNALFSNSSVAANDTVIINLSQVLATNEVVKAKASVNSALNLTMSGVTNDGPIAQGATYIADGSVTTSKLAIGAVATEDIANNAVTQVKLASNLSGITVTTAALRSTAVPVPFEGQMIYETDTDMVAIWNGSAWRYIAATTPTNGTVLQIAYGSTTSEVAINSTSFSSIGLSASITPKSTSSKVLVQASVQYRIRDANATAWGGKIVRNGVDVYTDGNGYAMGYSFNSSGSSGRAFLQYLDSPTSTSSLTYTVHARSFGTGIVDFQDDNIFMSSITLMEIAG